MYILIIVNFFIPIKKKSIFNGSFLIKTNVKFLFLICLQQNKLQKNELKEFIKYDIELFKSINLAASLKKS